MLRLHASIPEITQHITDPIAEQVIRKLISDLGAGPIFGANIHINTDHTTNAITIDEHHNLMLPTDNKFTCEVIPNLEPRGSHYDTLTPNNIMLPFGSDRKLDNYAIFHDSEIGVVATEQLVPCNIELECTLEFGKRSHAYEFFTRLKTYAISCPSYPIDGIQYDYKIPDHLYTTLFSIYKLKYPDFGVRFIDWLRDWSGKQFSAVLNRTFERNTVEIIVQKTISNISTNLTFTETKPEAKMTNRSPDGYILRCRMVVQFARPNVLWMEYPIIINNTLVPETALPKEILDPEVKLATIQASRSLDASYQALQVHKKTPIRLPWYDDWAVPDNSGPAQFDYDPFLIIAFTLDSKTDPTIIDLSGDLGGVSLTPELLTEILGYPNSGILHLGNKFHVGIYADGVQIDVNLLSITPEGILSVSCTDWNKVYRLVVSESKEITDGINTTARVNLVDIIVNREKSSI